MKINTITDAIINTIINAIGNGILLRTSWKPQRISTGWLYEIENIKR